MLPPHQIPVAISVPVAVLPAEVEQQLPVEAALALAPVLPVEVALALAQQPPAEAVLVQVQVAERPGNVVEANSVLADA